MSKSNHAFMLRFLYQNRHSDQNKRFMGNVTYYSRVVTPKRAVIEQIKDLKNGRGYFFVAITETKIITPQVWLILLIIVVIHLCMPRLVISNTEICIYIYICWTTLAGLRQWLLMCGHLQASYAIGWL